MQLVVLLICIACKKKLTFIRRSERLELILSRPGTLFQNIQGIDYLNSSKLNLHFSGPEHCLKWKHRTRVSNYHPGLAETASSLSQSKKRNLTGYRERKMDQSSTNSTIDETIPVYCAGIVFIYSLILRTEQTCRSYVKIWNQYRNQTEIYWRVNEDQLMKMNDSSERKSRNDLECQCLEALKSLQHFLPFDWGS